MFGFRVIKKSYYVEMGIIKDVIKCVVFYFLVV